MLHSAFDLSLSLSSLCISLSPPPLLHLHIPAVCLSALSQWWCETWRQGAWAASSYCDLQPRHLSSACQCHSRPLLGIYTESTPCARVFSCCLDHLDRKAYCYSRREHNLFLKKEPQQLIWQIFFTQMNDSKINMNLNY